MLERILGEEERDYITMGIAFMRKNKLESDDLKSPHVLAILSSAGVRADICLQMQEHAKSFKTIWKSNRAAAEGLIRVARPGESIALLYRQEFGGYSSYTSDDLAGFFDRY